MPSVIYQPKGAALEYSPLACNLWLTCSHGCTYCYGPACLHKKKEEFFIEAPERKDILSLLEKDCKELAGDPRPILLCFVTDPYQPHDEKVAITRQALEIMEKYCMTAQVLTKGGFRAVRDFDILRRNEWKFGATIHMEEDCKEWEPGAASNRERLKTIAAAHELGIFTWVSVEPVIYPEQTLSMIANNLDIVDFWKIGKLNHHKETEMKNNWPLFIKEIRSILQDQDHYIKTDLLAWENK